jgi:hypothetical protein
MGLTPNAPFSSRPVPALTKVANSSCSLFFFLSSAQGGFFFWEHFFCAPRTPAQVKRTYLHLDYLRMHPDFLPPSPTYLWAHLPTHLSTYTPIYLPFDKLAYLCIYALSTTKTMIMQVDEAIANEFDIFIQATSIHWWTRSCNTLIELSSQLLDFKLMPYTWHNLQKHI